MTPWAVLSIRKSIKGQGTPAHGWFGISLLEICIETLQTRKPYYKNPRWGSSWWRKNLYPIETNTGKILSLKEFM